MELANSVTYDSSISSNLPDIEIASSLLNFTFAPHPSTGPVASSFANVTSLAGNANNTNLSPPIATSTLQPSDDEWPATGPTVYTPVQGGWLSLTSFTPVNTEPVITDSPTPISSTESFSTWRSKVTPVGAMPHSEIVIINGDSTSTIAPGFLSISAIASTVAPLLPVVVVGGDGVTSILYPTPISGHNGGTPSQAKGAPLLVALTGTGTSSSSTPAPIIVIDSGHISTLPAGQQATDSKGASLPQLTVVDGSTMLVVPPPSTVVNNGIAVTLTAAASAFPTLLDIDGSMVFIPTQAPVVVSSGVTITLSPNEPLTDSNGNLLPILVRLDGTTMFFPLQATTAPELVVINDEKTSIVSAGQLATDSNGAPLPQLTTLGSMTFTITPTRVQTSILDNTILETLTPYISEENGSLVTKPPTPLVAIVTGQLITQASTPGLSTTVIDGQTFTQLATPVSTIINGITYTEIAAGVPTTAPGSPSGLNGYIYLNF